MKEIIARMLEVDPEKRYSAKQALKEKLFTKVREENISRMHP